MKTYLLKPMVVVCLCLLTASFTFAADNYKMVKVKAPFPMQPIKVFIYPDKDFLITDYGAKNGGKLLPLLKRVINQVADVLLFRQVYG